MPLLRGLKSLLAQPGVDPNRIRLMMIGYCDRWNDVDLVEWVRANDLYQCVSFRSIAAPSAVRDLARSSNVLINFAQNQKMQVPGKLYEQIASGRHVLLFTEADSESAKCVAGLSNITRLDDDDDAVQRHLAELYARLVIQRNPNLRPSSDIQRFSRRHSNDLFEQLLNLAAVTN
jgi:hypothetical protein